jgi:hypothetical protein
MNKLTVKARRCRETRAALEKARDLTIVLFVLTSSIATAAEMITNDALGNDPEREKLCIERTNMGKPLPFEIDKDYVKRSRAHDGDPVWIVVPNGGPHGMLVECSSAALGGKYGPISYDNNEGRLWRRLNVPKRFEPSVFSNQGWPIARKRCVDAVEGKPIRPGYDHIDVRSPAKELGNGETRSISSVKAEEWDLIVTGTAVYKTSRPDPDNLEFTCLLSPMLEVKAIEIK